MKSIYSLLLVGIALLTSCTEEIKIILGSTDPELVVEGAITTDTLAHIITLKRTAYYFSNQQAGCVTGATVTLSDGTNEIILTEDPLQKGNYLTPANYYGVAGHTYTLNISNVDINNDSTKEIYTSSCYLNNVPRIDSMSVEKKQVFYQNAFAVRISMQDPANETNYYLFRNWKNGICLSDSIDEWGITDDQFFNGKYLKNESVMYLFPKEKPDENVTPGDTIKVEMCGITKDYLSYINEVVDEYRGRNPLFGGQPANIRTNIKRAFPLSQDGKGARGYFAAYSVAWKQTIYKEKQ
ncbi:DUF4249 domain-containing protein [Parabacteroides sp. FAFU027]|uniref:DUF4249 domain-containing protein n=1 Tax=Parabacteroides sp. FAFU027 TaxID=2922715 RepID=UPI001FAFD27B|nr:DUF4249 domain-containing protein [Parabacteroides sp. FAFU027]